MKKLLFFLFMTLTCSTSYAQHTWTFGGESVTFSGPEVSCYWDSIDVAQLKNAYLPCYQLTSLSTSASVKSGVLRSIYVWGQLMSGAMTASDGVHYQSISLNGFFEIPDFNAATDRLVINQMGWTGAGYGVNSHTVTPIFKCLFPSYHGGSSMLILSIDWYRNDVLITDPSTAAKINAPVQSTSKDIRGKYNISGISVDDDFKGVIIEGGKKYINR